MVYPIKQVEEDDFGPSCYEMFIEMFKERIKERTR